MGAVTPVISAVGALSSVAGGLITAKQKADAAASQANIQKQAIRAQTEAEKKEKNAALRRAVARRRALYGANNVSIEGSGEAVLLGLYEETEDDLKKREELDRLRMASLDNSASLAQTRSLLDAASVFSTVSNRRSHYL